VSDEIDEVIEFFPTHRQAEKMLPEGLGDEAPLAGNPLNREGRVMDRSVSKPK
jgi:hypothetical protein